MRILLLLLTLFLASPVVAQEAEPTGTIIATDDAAQDAAIAQRLRGILEELGGYSDVTVTVSSGIVTFRGTTLSLEETSRLTTIAGRVEGVVAIENEVTETTDVAARLDPVRERLQGRLAQFATLAPLLAIAGAVFAIVLLSGLLLARARFISRLAPNAFIADIYRMVVRLAFLVIGIVLALDILGATALLSTILGAAGIIGLAVGFAVRDTVENFIASIMLSIRQPFRPNDAVEINGDEGLVIRLTSRATILLSFDGNHIRIPNATVFKSRIVNYSTNPERRFLFEIGVASDADLAAMRHLAEETVASLPYTLKEPAPSVWTDRIGDGAIFLKVTGWIDQRTTSLLQARSEALRNVKAAIEATGVEVPDTTYRVALTAPLASVPEPAPSPKPPVIEFEADNVTEAAPQALTEMVSAEQQDEDKPNLLREDAPEE
ncbi:MAG: mechanosensitive ion channel domain-containing protein [Pseudomonadota bacterium]